MNETNKRLVLGFALLAMVLGACSTHRNVQLYRAGLISKQAADSAYAAIYLAHRNGKISEEIMGKADVAYDDWAVAQKEYADGLADAVLTNTDPKTIALRHALSAIMAIAAQHGAL